MEKIDKKAILSLAVIEVLRSISKNKDTYLDVYLSDIFKLYPDMIKKNDFRHMQNIINVIIEYIRKKQYKVSELFILTLISIIAEEFFNMSNGIKAKAWDKMIIFVNSHPTVRQALKQSTHEWVEFDNASDLTEFILEIVHKSF